MKTLKWKTLLEEQERRFNKVLFTVTELAHVANTSPRVLNVELNRLRKQKILEQYARGTYGLPDRATPEDLLPYLDPMAYITGAYALFRHNIIMQVPSTITCFTSKRHNRSRIRATAIGKFEFQCVKEVIFSPPPGGIVCPPEQALCDCVYMMRRRGVNPQSVFSFRNLTLVPYEAAMKILYRYPGTVKMQVKDLLGAEKS